MKEYTLKEAAEYLGMTYKQFHYAVSKGFYGLNKLKNTHTKQDLDTYMIGYLHNKITKSTNDEISTRWMARYVAFQMKSFASDITGMSDRWNVLAGALDKNAAKITAFVDAHK